MSCWTSIAACVGARAGPPPRDGPQGRVLGQHARERTGVGRARALRARRRRARRFRRRAASWPPESAELHAFDSARPVTVRIPLDGRAVRLTSHGAGDIYVTVRARGLAAGARPPFDHALRVRRSWTDADGAPIDPVKLTAGDLVWVGVTIAARIEARRTVDNVAIVDALPGGLEIEHPLLATSAAVPRAGRPPGARPATERNRAGRCAAPLGRRVGCHAGPRRVSRRPRNPVHAGHARCADLPLCPGATTVGSSPAADRGVEHVRREHRVVARRRDGGGGAVNERCDGIAAPGNAAQRCAVERARSAPLAPRDPSGALRRRHRRHDRVAGAHDLLARAPVPT